MGLLTCKNRNNNKNSRFQTILWVCFISNAVMFLVQIVSSYFADSVSLFTNSLDFLSDSVNYAISLFVLQRSIRTMAKASIIKGISFGVVGLWAAYEIIDHSITQNLPDSFVMAIISILALLVNVVCAFLLYHYRNKDSNSQSIWICSRNDAIGNIAVMIAAFGIYTSGTVWPDIIVATVLIYLAISGAIQILNRAVKDMNILKE